MLVNITIQSFKSENELELSLLKWDSVKDKFMPRLDRKGLKRYSITRIWNKDSKLMRFVIFKYSSPEALNKCLPIWKEVEKHIFQNAVVKVTAYRGVSSEYWEPS